MKTIVAFLLVLSASPAFGQQLQGGVSQTMLDPGISGGSGKEPCYYGEQVVEYYGRRETIYATIRAYPHSIDNARLAPQGNQPRMFGALSGSVEGTMTYDGMQGLSLHITRLYSANQRNDYLPVDLMITQWSLVKCPTQRPPPKRTAPRRSNGTIADCEQFRREAESIQPSPRPVGKCQLICMYNICQQTGLTATPLFNQCGPQCQP